MPRHHHGALGQVGLCDLAYERDFTISVPNGVHVVAEGAIGRIPADLAPGEYRAVGGRLVAETDEAT